ncbi:MAG TPA: flagellar hook-basal body complex protein FliE [Acidimicrobiales bacterium]|nr:flagellar hook-basal body complex protein FliE [Acidimicrobiales bacterium]
MAIAPIGALASLPPLVPTTPPTVAAAPDPSALGASATAPAGGDGFQNAVSNAVDELQKVQSTASNAEAQAAAGQGNLADTMIAASQASLDTEVTTSLLNQATTAYNAIVNMSF